MSNEIDELTKSVCNISMKLGVNIFVMADNLKEAGCAVVIAVLLRRRCKRCRNRLQWTQEQILNKNCRDCIPSAHAGISCL